MEEEVLDDACIKEIPGMYLSVYRLPSGNLSLLHPSFLLFNSGITCDDQYRLYVWHAVIHFELHLLIVALTSAACSL